MALIRASLDPKRKLDLFQALCSNLKEGSETVITVCNASSHTECTITTPLALPNSIEVSMRMLPFVNISTIRLSYEQLIGYTQTPIIAVNKPLGETNNIDIFEDMNIPVTTQIIYDTIITGNSENKITHSKIPVFYDTKLKVTLRHGIEGLWYIRKDGKPLSYQYWLYNKLVSKEEYDQYMVSYKQELQRQDILLPDIRRLIVSYMD